MTCSIVKSSGQRDDLLSALGINRMVVRSCSRLEEASAYGVCQRHGKGGDSLAEPTPSSFEKRGSRILLARPVPHVNSSARMPRGGSMLSAPRNRSAVG